MYFFHRPPTKILCIYSCPDETFADPTEKKFLNNCKPGFVGIATKFLGNGSWSWEI